MPSYILFQNFSINPPKYLHSVSLQIILSVVIHGNNQSQLWLLKAKFPVANNICDRNHTVSKSMIINNVCNGKFKVIKFTTALQLINGYNFACYCKLHDLRLVWTFFYWEIIFLVKPMILCYDNIFYPILC